VGVSGWRERQDGVTVSGVVVGHDKALDGDWTLLVKPDPEFEGLLHNHGGARNADGNIECEVEPSDFIEDGPVDSWEPVFFGQLMGKHVTVTGTWSDDLSHADKTEIHPIVSLVEETTTADHKRVQLFAFADDSGNTFATVPHSGVSRVVHVRIPFAGHVKLPHHQVTPHYVVHNEWCHVKSRHFTIDESNEVPVLDVLIETGVADDHQGFYFGSLSLQYDDVRLTIPYNVVPAAPRLNITHVERRLSRSNRGPTHQSYIYAIGGTHAGVYWKLTKDIAIHLITSKTTTFFVTDGAGHEADVEVVEPHRTKDDEFFYQFLRTEADGVDGNELTDLPPCPVYLDELP
jgi:hypothetical protein